MPIRGFIAKDQYHSFLTALEKGVEWQKRAKEDELQMSRLIKSFITARNSFSETGVYLTFSSSDKGKETLVVMQIIDFENPFSRDAAYLDPEQLAAFIANIKKLPAIYGLLKKDRQKDDDILD